MRIWMLLFAVAWTARGAPLERDLGRGLIYFRVHEIPADLPAADRAPERPCVLDLRYVHGGSSETSALAAWVKSRAGVRHPVILLANVETSAALLAPFKSADAVPGLVVIGPDAAQFATDISVTTAPGRERRAYDALEHGTPVEKLIDDTPKDKPRNDEARLAREHLSDAEMAAEEDAPPAKDAPAARRPLIDRELQRAVQLHRALLALKRL